MRIVGGVAGGGGGANVLDVFAADRGLPVCECVACCAHVLLLLLLLMRLIACLKRASDRPGSLSGKWPHYRSSITINRARRQKMAHPQDQRAVAAPRLQGRNLLSIQRRFACLLRCPKDNRSVSGRVQLLSYSTAALQDRTFSDSGKGANAHHALRINVTYDVNSIRLALTGCPRARCTNRLVPAASNGGV